MQRDPLMHMRAYFDICGISARPDAVSIWTAQFVRAGNRRPELLRGAGHPLSVLVDWMRSRGYSNTWVILPHDA
ncbi:hypothetical protein [Bradyrhizobium elkanii]|uniref:hypothetical protein n=1 Tax=Bradyrhizobium elkanii TaxID=29448 RepID=UPI00084162CE|nr:hypothetical protein [Bradyrhizobium elkanii]ODM71379.1 hypothetical protein A6452_09405 [Bradyrhizobium elkanii]ODM76107.1 hypothetical protein A6X20_30295 [Bradyrhizobium elkanii]